MTSIVPYVFQPTIDAFFCRDIPFHLRWRMLLLQQISLITISIVNLQCIFSPPFTAITIPNRHGRRIRALLYLPKRRKISKLSPLHISFHAGAFIGGFPEAQAHFNKLLPERLGCVVVAPHYRYAPRYVFPAAIDDAEDVVKWCLENCEELWGADPKLVTTSGFSAGGNLAVAVCQNEIVRKAVMASVTAYGVMDLRVSPWQKPKPENFPKRDPMAVLLPLFDSYPALVRADNMSNPRLSPIISDVEKLPPRMLLIVPSIDILVHEQLTMAERVQREIKEKRLDKLEGRSCEARVFEGAFHGWFELPYLPSKLMHQRVEATDMAIDFLNETHCKHGWTWTEEE